ncbi:hypothetical protein KC887_04855 [Candidatus Kaiserbacteria bacterium]|nr:hypothetical protein [Candidatus Kaiserbacteria bacterium]
MSKIKVGGTPPEVRKSRGGVYGDFYEAVENAPLGKWVSITDVKLHQIRTALYNRAARKQYRVETHSQVNGNDGAVTFWARKLENES